MSFVASPTPANGLRHAINRHSMDVDVGDSARPSLELDVGSSEGGRPSIDSAGPGARPSMDSECSRPSFDSVRPLSPAQRLVQQKQNQLVKQSTASSMLSLSSVNSSPCPRPPRRKLLMLAGGRLPRAPVAAPVFKAAAPAIAPSPAPGRVRRLKDSWEAKLSPKKEETVRCEYILMPLSVRLYANAAFPQLLVHHLATFGLCRLLSGRSQKFSALACLRICL